MDKGFGTHFLNIEIRCFIQSHCHRCVKSTVNSKCKNSHRQTPKLVESLPRRVEAVIAEKGGTNSILTPIDLEWDFIKAPVAVMCRWSNTFGHMVCFEMVLGLFLNLSWKMSCPVSSSNVFINENLIKIFDLHYSSLLAACLCNSRNREKLLIAPCPLYT